MLSSTEVRAVFSFKLRFVYRFKNREQLRTEPPKYPLKSCCMTQLEALRINNIAFLFPPLVLGSNPSGPTNFFVSRDFPGRICFSFPASVIQNHTSRDGRSGASDGNDARQLDGMPWRTKREKDSGQEGCENCDATPSHPYRGQFRELIADKVNAPTPHFVMLVQRAEPTAVPIPRIAFQSNSGRVSGASLFSAIGA